MLTSALAAGCGDDDSSDDVQPAGTSPADPGTTPTGGAAVPQVDGYGFVSLRQLAPSETLITAEFAAEALPVLDDCVQVTEDSATGCRVLRTPRGCNSRGTADFLSAGDLTVAVSRNAITMPPNSSGAYNGNLSPGVLDDAQPIELRASGSLPEGVPPFDLQVSPLTPSVDTVAVDFGTQISRNAAHTITWDNSPALQGTLDLRILNYSFNGSTLLSCVALDPAAQSVTLPASMTQMLANGPVEVTVYHSAIATELVGAAPEPVFSIQTHLRQRVAGGNLPVVN
ncbi:MAG: hypothetical protein ACPGUV_03315 [Polyangiales bacterium]